MVSALREMPRLEVEALFLDIHMPGTDGFELLEVEPFCEGSLPRRLVRVTMRRPSDSLPES
jgi:response regulator of citrate/malate metabolism